jgi:hypothetical protein
MRGMATAPPVARAPLLVAVSVATLLALALRAWGITGQVVLDDEWHALHKLAASSYAQVFKSFGMADHSIPLTLFYKAMADTFGLAEGRLRALQVACGVAVVPLAASLAWRATRDAPAAALFAFLAAAAPFLVLWSRFARPYAVTLLLTVLCLAALWRWRARRSWPLAACVALTASLLAWLHPVAGIYPALGCLFVYAEDLATQGAARPRPSWRSFALGALVAAAMLLPLAVPLLHDRRSLAAKAGGDQPGWETYERMVAIFWGGVPTPVVGLGCAAAAWGWVTLYRRDTPLACYLALLALAPVAILTLLGAQYAHLGETFGRYVLPLQLILLFLGSLGAITMVRAIARRRAEAAAWGAALLLSAGYVWATPAIAQVATLGTWYGHFHYHRDYRELRMGHRRHDPRFEPPAFYRKLARMAPGSAPIIEAPFTYEQPFDRFAYYASFHRQPETFGMLHDLCLGGERQGETPPRDRRFRFRKFVHLEDVAGVRQTGARYLLLARESLHGRPFSEDVNCIARLAALYGPPVELDARLAVFDLRPAEPQPKLQ